MSRQVHRQTDYVANCAMQTSQFSSLLCSCFVGTVGQGRTTHLQSHSAQFRSASRSRSPSPARVMRGGSSRRLSNITANLELEKLQRESRDLSNGTNTAPTTLKDGEQPLRAPDLKKSDSAPTDERDYRRSARSRRRSFADVVIEASNIASTNSVSTGSQHTFGTSQLARKNMGALLRRQFSAEDLSRQSSNSRLNPLSATLPPQQRSRSPFQKESHQLQGRMSSLPTKLSNILHSKNNSNSIESASVATYPDLVNDKFSSAPPTITDNGASESSTSRNTGVHNPISARPSLTSTTPDTRRSLTSSSNTSKTVEERSLSRHTDTTSTLPDFSDGHRNTPPLVHTKASNLVGLEFNNRFGTNTPSTGRPPSNIFVRGPYTGQSKLAGSSLSTIYSEGIPSTPTTSSSIFARGETRGSLSLTVKAAGSESVLSRSSFSKRATSPSAASIPSRNSVSNGQSFSDASSPRSRVVSPEFQKQSSLSTIRSVDLSSAGSNVTTKSAETNGDTATSNAPRPSAVSNPSLESLEHSATAMVPRLRSFDSVSSVTTFRGSGTLPKGVLARIDSGDVLTKEVANGDSVRNRQSVPQKISNISSKRSSSSMRSYPQSMNSSKKDHRASLTVIESAEKPSPQMSPRYSHKIDTSRTSLSQAQVTPQSLSRRKAEEGSLSKVHQHSCRCVSCGVLL